jgi:hypothetical protein
VFLALIPQLRELPGAAGCDPGALAVLDRVVRGSFERPELDPANAVVSIRSAALSSLYELIDAISIECRLIVVLDDLHNVDAASWQMLLRLMQAGADQRIYWIGTSRLKPASLDNGDEVHSAGVSTIHVPPLDAHEAVALTSALREHASECNDLMASEPLSRLAGGNPLFIRELCAERTLDMAPEELPRSLRALMEDRLSQLEPDCLRVLRLASLLAPHATVARLRRAHSGTAASLAAAVERLELDGIIRLGSTHVLDLHECWHHAVNDSLTGATRALFAHECAHILHEESRLAPHVDLAWRSAELFLEAGDTTEALACFMRCAEQTLGLGFPSEAVSILERAYRLVRHDHERMTIGVRLATALHSCWRAEEAITLCTQLLSTQATSVPTMLAERATALCLRMDSLTKCNRDHRADLQEMARLARDKRLTPTARQFICLNGLRVVFNDAKSDLEELFFTVSTGISAEHGHSITGLLAQLIFCVERGQAEKVNAILDALEAMESRVDSVILANLARRYRINAIRWLGFTERAMDIAEDAFHDFRSRGFVEEAASTSELMTFASLDANDLERAQLWIQRLEDSGRVKLRARAQSHARARLLMQLGDIQGALKCSLPRLEQAHEGLMEKMRVVELATVAFCATNVGAHALGTRCLESTEEIISANDPSRFMDYPAEMAIRTRQQLGHADTARQLADNYARRRLSEHRLPIAPFYTSIRERTLVRGLRKT